MNNISLFGRLTSEPELKASGDNKYVRFCLAVDRRTKEKKTDFIDCIAFNRLAEVICQYVHKGNQLSVIGSLETGSFEKNGESRKTYNVNVKEIDFVSQPRSAEPAQASQETAVTADDQQFEPNFTVNDGDLPFSI